MGYTTLIGTSIEKLSSILAFVSLPYIRYFTRHERRTLRLVHSLFLVFFVIFLALGLSQALDVFAQTKVKLQSQAAISAFRASLSISSTLDQQFDDLHFLGSFFYTDSRLLPAPSLQQVYNDFRKSHPDMPVIMIEDPRFSHSIWSSTKDFLLPTPALKTLIAIPRSHSELISRPIYNFATHQWLMELFVQVIDSHRQTLGYVGSPILLSQLSQVPIPENFNAVIWNPRHQSIEWRWIDGQWEPTVRFKRASTVTASGMNQGKTIAIGGFPWQINVDWNRTVLWTDDWLAESKQLPLLLSIFVLMIFMDFLTQHLIRRLLRQRAYLDAALAIQKSAMITTSPNEVFHEVVNILAEITDGTMFYIQDGEDDDPSAQLLAIQQNRRLRSSSRLVVETITTPAQLCAIMTSQGSPWSSRMIKKYFSLRAAEIPLQLVVGSEERFYFTKAICNLLTELSFTLRNILEQWHETQMRRVAEAELALEANIRLNLINNIGIGIFLSSFKRMILRANRRVTEIFGYTEDELVGQSFRMIYPSDEHFNQIGNHYHLLTDPSVGMVHREYLFQRKDRTTFIGEIFGTLLDSQSPEKGVIWTIQDISDKIALQRAIESHNERMRSELELAASLQRAFLPNSTPLLTRIDIAWEYIPSNFLAGDMIGALMIDDAHLGFYVLDVMGHGVSSALNAISINYFIRPSENDKSRSLHPGDLLTFINEKFGDFFLTESYFTLFYGVLNIQTLTLSYARGGHPAPILLHANGDIEYLDKGNFPLGLIKNADYQEYHTQLYPGDKLLAYSDGLTDLFNKNGEMFSAKRVSEWMLRLKHLDIHQLTKQILSAIERFTDTTSWNDDVTVIGLEVRN